MNTNDTWNRIEANWDQFKGQVKKQWGQLTDDEMVEIEGRKDILIGKIQDRYSLTMEQAKAQVDQWLESLDSH